MSAVRLARGFTGRDRIVKFAGNHHGHADSLLVAAGSSAATLEMLRDERPYRELERRGGSDRGGRGPARTPRQGSYQPARPRRRGL